MTTKVRLTITVCLILIGALASFGQTPQVAILDSANTKDYFARHYPNCDPGATVPSYYLGANEYQRYFRGWQWVLDQDPAVPYATIYDENITDGSLDNYKLLILSNNASLTEAQSRAIHAWIIRGGRLLATFGSGYKSITEDLREADSLKLQKGGTFGLHQLWHDPASKMFTSYAITPGVDVQITRYAGPTQGLEGVFPGGRLGYGALANMLVQRPLQFQDVVGFLTLEEYGWKRPAPAILDIRAGRGKVVYFAFAPEYIVSKEYGLPTDVPCPDGQNWTGRSLQGAELMRNAVQYLLQN